MKSLLASMPVVTCNSPRNPSQASPLGPYEQSRIHSAFEVFEATPRQPWSPRVIVVINIYYYYHNNNHNNKINNIKYNK